MSLPSPNSQNSQEPPTSPPVLTGPDGASLDETPALDDGKPMMEPGEPRIGRDGAPVIDSKGNPKLTSVPVIYKEWVALVNEDGVQAVDHDGVALHWGKGGAPLQLVKNGVPVPFRVRARRMTVL